MAKTPTPVAAVATVNVGGFQFDTGLPVPSVRAGAAKTSEDAAKLKAMPVGASFLTAVAVPDSVKDPVEIEKTFKELARSVTNRLSGLARRFAKQNAGFAFALRTVNDDVQGRGVRVYRVAVEEAVAGTVTETGTESGGAPAST